jgi:CBS domain-containing protein
MMIRDPATLPVHAPLAQAAARRADRDLKRLPVVDERGRLVGMVRYYKNNVCNEHTWQGTDK